MQTDREELRNKLREKINGKKTARQHSKYNRKQLISYSEKLKKISNCIGKYDIKDTLPTELLEEIKALISEEELSGIMEYLKNNNAGKLNSGMMELLEKINVS